MNILENFTKRFRYSKLSTTDGYLDDVRSDDDDDDEGHEDKSKNNQNNTESKQYPNDDESTKISSVNAFWNVCNSIQGVAILAMPYVIKGGGWWSIVAMVIVAAISNYTGQILIKCHYEDVEDTESKEIVSIRIRQTYAEIGTAIWPEYGKQTVLFIQVLELLFMATLYPIVTVSVLHALIPVQSLPSGIWIIVFGCVVYPNVFLKRLYHISLMSTVTVVSAGFVTAAVVMYCFTSAASWKLGQMSVVNPKEFIAAIGVIIASYSSQMYLSVIEASMKNPKRVGSVMNYGYSAMTILKIGIGIVAYMTFGESTSQVVTLNLPSGLLLTAVNVVVLLLALSSYTLPMFTVFEILERDSPFFAVSEVDGEDRNVKRRIVLRTALVLITLLLAVSVPHFCLFLSFIGCFTGSFLEIIFPCVFYIILKWDKLPRWEIFFNIFLITFSLVFMGAGMFHSGLALVKAFRLHTKEVWTVE